MSYQYDRDGNVVVDGAGWTPTLALVTDGDRVVQQIVDWFGGVGTKPSTGLYVGASGYVSDIADAVDIRGADGGASGSPPQLATSTQDVSNNDKYTVNADADFRFLDAFPVGGYITVFDLADRIQTGGIEIHLEGSSTLEIAGTTLTDSSPSGGFSIFQIDASSFVNDSTGLIFTVAKRAANDFVLSLVEPESTPAASLLPNLATLADAQALSTSLYRQMNADGSLWVSTDADISAQVVSGVFGIAIGTTADTTGASGGWLRQYDGKAEAGFFCVADGVELNDAAITSGNATLTSASASFSSEDIGKTICVRGAGSPFLTTTITSINSSTSVELSANATSTVSGANAAYGTDDSSALKSALLISEGNFNIGSGIYFLQSALDFNGTWIYDLSVTCENDAILLFSDIEVPNCIRFRVPNNSTATTGLKWSWHGGKIDVSRVKNSTVLPFIGDYPAYNAGTLNTASCIDLHGTYTFATNDFRVAVEKMLIEDVWFFGGTHWEIAGSDTLVGANGYEDLGIGSCRFDGARDAAIYTGGGGTNSATLINEDTKTTRVVNNSFHSCFGAIEVKRSSGRLISDGNYFYNCVSTNGISQLSGGGARSSVLGSGIYEKCQLIAKIDDAQNIVATDIGSVLDVGCLDASGTPISFYDGQLFRLEGAKHCSFANARITGTKTLPDSAAGTQIVSLEDNTSAGNSQSGATITCEYNDFENIISTNDFTRAVFNQGTGDNNSFKNVIAQNSRMYEGVDGDYLHYSHALAPFPDKQLSTVTVQALTLSDLATFELPAYALKVGSRLSYKAHGNVAGTNGNKTLRQFYSASGSSLVKTFQGADEFDFTLTATLTMVTTTKGVWESKLVIDDSPLEVVDIFETRTASFISSGGTFGIQGNVANVADSISIEFFEVWMEA